jgi:hypothetical protein
MLLLSNFEREERGTMIKVFESGAGRAARRFRLADVLAIVRIAAPAKLDQH